MRIARGTTRLALGLMLACGLTPARAIAADPPTISPADLAGALQRPAAERPLVIQVGFRIMYDQAHIPGAEYIGPGSDASAIDQLRKRVQPLKRDAAIVLYCGCCPWDRCPNVRPAAALLTSMGFTNVKVLHIADNFGADWVGKGYPVQKGR
ncbi:MAG: rhodanese-like domain-containing protein [Betaproteobacteria bacterium]